MNFPFEPQKQKPEPRPQSPATFTRPHSESRLFVRLPLRLQSLGSGEFLPFATAELGKDSLLAVCPQEHWLPFEAGMTLVEGALHLPFASEPLCFIGRVQSMEWRDGQCYVEIKLSQFVPGAREQLLLFLENPEGI